MWSNKRRVVKFRDHYSTTANICHIRLHLELLENFVERTASGSSAPLFRFCKRQSLHRTPKPRKGHVLLSLMPCAFVSSLQMKYTDMRSRASTNKDIISEHEDAIISSIRAALVDSEPSVRAAAAKTFDSAQHYMGTKAIDQTIPTLLEAMRHPGESSETALQALQEVMSVSTDFCDICSHF